MGEPKRPSRLRRSLFDRPILKLFVVLLLIVVAFALAESISIPLLGFLALLVAIIAMAYAIVLIGYMVSLYLIKGPLERLFTARDLASLLLSYVMFIVIILLMISVLFIVVQDLKLGYLTYDPTQRLSRDMIDNENPNVSQDYLYFTTVTFFSVGYGDVCPMGLCKLLAMLAAFAGNVVTVVLMAIVVSAYLNRRSSDQASRVQPERKADS
jgi:voltage-gated potassium channel Kch